MKPTVLLGALLVLGGCATTGDPALPTTMQVPVKVPCVKSSEVPVKPPLVTDAQLKGMRGDTFVLALYNDRLKRIGYEEKLEAVLSGCVGDVPVPAGVDVPKAQPAPRSWEFWKR